MVVCTFLESYDLSKHVVVPFFTYGATTYLNESMQKIYKCTPNSVHVPEMLPEDLDADDITRPGRPDDAGIYMPGNAAGVETWLTRLGLIGNTGTVDIGAVEDVRITTHEGTVHVELGSDMQPNTIEIYDVSGTLVYKMADKMSYSFTAPSRSVYLLSMVYGVGKQRLNRKIVI